MLFSATVGFSIPGQPFIMGRVAAATRLANATWTLRRVRWNAITVAPHSTFGNWSANFQMRFCGDKIRE